MREAFRGGWPFGHPPNMDYELNWRSPQADGLVMWMPLGVNRSTGSRHIDMAGKLTFSVGGTPTWMVDNKRGWFLIFDDGASEYLQSLSTRVTAPPFTMMSWFQIDDNSLSTIVSIGDAGNVNFHALRRPGFSGLTAYSKDAAAADSATAGGGAPSANTWHHGCGVWYATNDRACWINGSNKGTNATDVTPVNVDRTAIASRAGIGNYLSGRASDIRIYDRALSDSEVHQQYTKPWELFSPRVRFWPGFADDGCITTVTVTETATVTVVAQV